MNLDYLKRIYLLLTAISIVIIPFDFITFMILPYNSYPFVIVPIYSIPTFYNTFMNIITFTLFAVGWLRLVLILFSRFFFHRLLYETAILYIKIVFLLLISHIIILTIILPFFLISIPFFIALNLLVCLIIINANLRWPRVLRNNEEGLIKKNILDLGTQFSQLEIVDIAERCSLNQEKIETVLRRMIENKEIFANYSIITKIIEFDQDLNIEEIDGLLMIYKEWEAGNIGKKKR